MVGLSGLIPPVIRAYQNEDSTFLQVVLFRHHQSPPSSLLVSFFVLHNKSFHQRKDTTMNDNFRIWVPSQSPQKWFIINTLCFLYSLASCIELVRSFRDLGERPPATANYIIYNFSTTIAWCLEAGFESWWSYKIEKEERVSSPLSVSPSPSWWHTLSNSAHFTNIAELAAAVFFLFDSADLLWTWKIKGQDVKELLYGVVLNLLFYLYAMIRDFVRLHQRPTTDSTSGQSNNNSGSSKAGFTQLL